MTEPIFSPLDFYLNDAKARHHQSVTSFYAEREQRSGISLAENAETVKKYRKKAAELDLLEKTVRRKKSGRGWSVFGIIALALCLIVWARTSSLGEALSTFFCFLSVAGGVVAVVFVCRAFGKTIRTLLHQADGMRQEAQSIADEAQKQTDPLCLLFTDEDALSLVERTMPCLSFDRFFTLARLNEMQAFGYTPSLSSDESVLSTLSGELYASPFLFERRIVHTMGTATYTGTLQISWETRERDAQGNAVTRRHTQTLRASIEKPKPYYSTATRLVYCHEEAPELFFSRDYKHVEDESEAALERKIRKGEKKLARLTDKSLKRGGDFIATANAEFDVLFNALNRSDELQFREMFTAKAQESMVKLLLYEDGYGDDFRFEKRGKLNIIQSEHSQSRPLNLSAADYRSFDAEEIKQSFIDKNDELFKGIYFDFAPLLLIPLYQRPHLKNKAFMDGERSVFNYEEFANCHSDLFRPSDAETATIFHAERDVGDEEIVSVHAYAYRTEVRTEYRQVRGNDGNIHSVPVHWTEYLPVWKTTKARFSGRGKHPQVTVL